MRHEKTTASCCRPSVVLRRQEERRRRTGGKVAASRSSVDASREGGGESCEGGEGDIVGGVENLLFNNEVYTYEMGPEIGGQRTFRPGVHFLFPACFVIHDIAYIGICQIETGYTKEFWAYNPATDGWSRKADYPGSAQSGSPNFAIGDFGYVASDSSTDFWMYDPRQINGRGRMMCPQVLVINGGLIL